MENQGFTGFIEDIDVSVIPDDPPGAKEFRESINIDPCVISNYPPHQAIDLIWESVSKLIGEGCSLDSFLALNPQIFKDMTYGPCILKQLVCTQFLIYLDIVVINSFINFARREPA